MRIQKRDGTVERRVLIGVITDKVVLAKIASKWTDDGLFNSRWSNQIARWCVDHFKKYEAAPGKDIEMVFARWAKKAKDKETVELVEKFLESLSGEYEEAKASNSQHLIDLAAELFNRVKLSKLKDDLEDVLETGDVQKAQEVVDGHSRVEMGGTDRVKVLSDQEAVKESMERESARVIEYPGALGEFFGDALERGGFIAFEGPDKRGKTFWLLDLAWRAMLQRRRVAFFEVGDMTKDQIMRRFMVRASRKPLKPCIIQYPTAIAYNIGDDMAAVTYEERKFDKKLSWQTAWKAFEETRKRLKTKEDLLYLSCHPNSSISILGIKSILDSWELEGWTPDVVIIDYADLLEAPSGQKHAETRDQIDATWKYMRGLSQQLSCLVVTATQTDANAYSTNIITKGNFSGDKRKNAHVTGMVGINATAQEMNFGIRRLNWVVLREAKYSETDCVHVAGCLGLANPSVKSTW